mgnify:CR=1 FL=1
MGRPEGHPQSLEEAKARFLEEMGKLTPSAWIREHPEMAIGGAIIAGVLIGSSEETMEAVARNGPRGIRLAHAFLAGIREGIPQGEETKA